MVHLAAFLFLLAIQGFLLQTAVALTGEAAPRYGRATTTALWAGFVGMLASLSFRFTAGLVVWMLMGSTAAWALSALVVWVATAVVYRRRLKLAGGHAMLVAAIHHGMAWALSGALWFGVSFIS